MAFNMNKIEGPESHKIEANTIQATPRASHSMYQVCYWDTGDAGKSEEPAAVWSPASGH